MKPIQCLLIVAIVLGLSACAKNADKRPPAAALSEAQSIFGAPVVTPAEPPFPSARFSTETHGLGRNPSDEKPNSEVLDARQAPDSHWVSSNGASEPFVISSNSASGGTTADANHRSSNDEDADVHNAAQINDPWERYNRWMYKFNTKVDKYIARPIGVAYDKVVPDLVQRRVTSFFANLQEPRTLVNQLLQGKPVGAATTLGRFVINSTAGVGGIFDPASSLELQRANEDLGQTLAVWGWGDSRFIVVPLQGPKTVRDFISGFGDKPLNPTGYIDNQGASMAITLIRMGSMRSAAVPLEKMRAEALDEYAFVRDAWMQKRRNEIGTK